MADNIDAGGRVFLQNTGDLIQRAVGAALKFRAVHSEIDAGIGRHCEGDLVTLARHLDLTWRHHLDGDLRETRRIPVSQIRLDEGLRDELLALAEIGHLAGLRDALQRAEQDRRLPPSLVGTLQAPLERFDFQSLIQLLEQTP